MKAKHIILFVSLGLIAFNTLLGVIMSSYDTTTYLLVDLGMCISAGLLFYLFDSDIADGFKITLFFLFCVTGLARTICMAIMETDLKDNVPFLIAVFIFLFEISLLFLTYYLSKK